MTSATLDATFARSSRSAPSVRGGAVIAGTMLVFAGAFAQSGERPQFEVASVKLSAEQSLIGVRSLPGGRLVATAPVKLLIMNAYALQRSQIIGGPEWINMDRYEIEAKSEGNTSRDRSMLMLQSLLEERFHLKTHRETRVAPAYVLVVGKNGPKLVPPREGGCATADTFPPLGRPDPATPPCEHIRISTSPSGVRMEGSRVPVSELVRGLAVALDRPVLDRTNMPGVFDIRLQFIDEPPGVPPSDSPGPSVFTALEEQLGLRLESEKGPVEFLVVDRVERPTAN